jgi:hypothetical protein
MELMEFERNLSGSFYEIEELSVSQLDMTEE